MKDHSGDGYRSGEFALENPVRTEALKEFSHQLSRELTDLNLRHRGLVIDMVLLGTLIFRKDKKAYK